MEQELDWGKVAGICTDGAPAMTGNKSGFKACVNNIAPHIQFTHCIIHRYALAMKTLPPGLLNILSDVIKIVNHIKGNAVNSRIFKVLCDEVGSLFTVLLYHTEVRWLSRGKVLHRILDLWDELIIFFERQKTERETLFHEKLKDGVFQLKVAYLADFFAEVNCLNLQFQGNEVNSLRSQDKVAAFHRKIQLCQRRVQSKDTTVFSALTNILVEKKTECTFISDISEHLKSLNETIKSYFPDIDQREKKSRILKPFSSELENVI